MNKNDINKFRDNVAKAWNRLDKEDRQDVSNAVANAAFSVTFLVKARKHYKRGDIDKALVFVALWAGICNNYGQTSMVRRLSSLDKATKRAEKSMYTTLRK